MSNNRFNLTQRNSVSQVKQMLCGRFSRISTGRLYGHTPSRQKEQTVKGFSKGTLLFCITLDIAILATMVLIAIFSKTAWGLVLIFALQKPDHKDSGGVEQQVPPDSASPRR
jgi:hypothetical protein